MLTNTLRCKNIVMNYITTAEDFFSGKSNDFIINNKHSISEIMFMIGMFNFTDLLDKFLNFDKLLKYYNSTNIFYFAMIGAIYQNNKDINKTISDNDKTNSDINKTISVSDNDKTDTDIKTDNYITEDTVITKLSKFGLDSNTYKDILESYIKTNNKELFDLIRNVYSSN